MQLNSVAGSEIRQRECQIAAGGYNTHWKPSRRIWVRRAAASDDRP